MQLSLILSPYPLEFQITLCEMAYGYCLKPLIPEDSILSTYFALNYLTEAESNKTSPTRKPSTGNDFSCFNHSVFYTVFISVVIPNAMNHTAPPLH